MKKLSLVITLVLAVLLLQNCKKDSITETATSTIPLFAYIDDTTWNASNFNASLTYNSIAKTKVFACTGFGSDMEVTFKITAANQTGNTASFPLQTFNADGVNTTFAYLTATSSSGPYVQQGTVAPESGTITFTSLDSVKRQCSGTFAYTSTQNNYDNQGNIISVTIHQVNGGAFNNLPYTFTSN